MAGLTGHKALTDGLFQMILAGERKIGTDAQEAALEAGVAGQHAAEWTIDHAESSLSPGKPNRNWTFNMRDSLDSRVRRDGTTINIRVGWLVNKEGYFLTQEDGGSLNGTTITPMHALINAHNAMIDTLKGWGLKIQ